MHAHGVASSFLFCLFHLKPAASPPVVMPLQSYEKKPKAQSIRLLFVTALVPTGRKQNGTVPDSHRESKNRPVITKVGNGLRAETVPKGRQSTAGGETPGKVGGLQALKGRRNTSRGDAPAILELLRPFRACFSLFYRGFHPRLYSDVPSGLFQRADRSQPLLVQTLYICFFLRLFFGRFSESSYLCTVACQPTCGQRAVLYIRKTFSKVCRCEL